MPIEILCKLPHRLTLRPYQLDVWDAFFNRGCRRFMNVWHRRAGKDKTFFNLMTAAAMQQVGNYIYCLPEIKHAKKVIWESIDPRTGTKFLDHIPTSLIDSIDKSELLIRLKNRSTIQLCGADNYDSLVGSNPIGIVYSEFALCHPLAWQYLQPILAENGGWAAFIFTPRGDNHAHALYEQNIENEAWYTNLLTVDDTKEWDNSACVSQEAIGAARKAGMSEQIIQQEFYCSFEAALLGAYWARELALILRKGQIYDYAINARFPINTYWDLGIGDSTAIWLVQQLGNGKYNILAYYENQGQRIDHYVQWLQDFQRLHNITWGIDYQPHDARNRSIQTGLSVADYTRDLGRNVKVIERPAHKQDAIEAARYIIPDCNIHKTNCRVGLACLRAYRASYNERMRTFSNPVHDWSSHGADAFMLFAQHALNATARTDRYPQAEIINNMVNCGEL